jgi:uncharacterized membrane protein
MSEILENSSQSTLPNTPAESLVQLSHVTYALYALGLLSAGLIAVAGLIIAYVKRDDARGTYLESHYGWLIRTFWWGIGWTALVWLFVIVTFGIGIFFAWIPWGIIWIWFAYEGFFCLAISRFDTPSRPQHRAPRWRRLRSGG